MENFRRVMTVLPAWCLSLTTLVIILWLTLASKPLGDEPPQFFPGADKVAHALMFGFFAAMMSLDWQRRHGWKKVNPTRIIIYSTVSAITGLLIEFAQAEMGLGRSFEVGDIIADASGAYIFAIIWIISQKLWIVDNP